MRTLRILLTAAALAAVCAPGAARAATVSLTYVGTTPASPDQYKIAGSPAVDRYLIRLVAGDGERNRMVVDVHGRLRDDGAPLVVGDGCVADAAGWVTCKAEPRPPALGVGYGYEIDAGDGDDTVTTGHDEHPNPSDATTGVGVGTVDLGAGDDLFTAPRGAGRIQGGPGRDTIVAPLRFGDRGPASWDPDAAAPDAGMLWDGGPGPDTASGGNVVVSYAGRTAGVRVTPDDVADDGEPGEGDDVGSDVPVIVGGDGPDELHAAGPLVAGGRGDDLLVGHPAPGPEVGDVPRLALRGDAGNDTIQGGPGAELVDGGPGDDTLAGGPGDDRLVDGAGADRVDGGEGDDRVDYVPDGAADVLHGGPGTDLVTRYQDGRPMPTVAISLNGRADDGPRGEGDDVADGWESVAIQGGSLTGGDAPEQLGIVEGAGAIDGGGGDDVLWGGTSITGGPGRDTIDAGYRVSGAVVHARDGEGDLVRCFERRVRVVADRIDRLLGCARPEVTASPHGTRALRDRGQLAVDVHCYGVRTCAGVLTVRAGARGAPPIGRARFAVWTADTVRVPVRLGDLPRRACGTLRVTLRLQPSHGQPTVTTIPLGHCTWRTPAVTRPMRRAT
ncbi:MAG TPA: calcium-binding protein [Baekduia sp.]|nr:calcium-binding protein [Baekduia sp.]